MTTNLGSASTVPADARLVSGSGLAVAIKDLGVALVLPYLALLGLQVGIGTLPLLLGRTVALVGPAIVLAWLWRRRSTYALWAAFLLALQMHATVWGLLPGLGVPVYGEYAIAADRALGFGELPTVLLQSMRTWVPQAVDTLAFLIYASFFVAPVVAFLGVWRLSRGLAATFARAMILASVIGLVVMAVVPTAPPWMAARQGATAPIERIGETLVGPVAHDQAEDLIGVNEVAAMPSLHTATTLLIALVLAAAIPPLRRWTWLYPLAMGFALVYLGEHYVVDVLAGLATAWVGWRLAGTSWGPFAASSYEDLRRSALVAAASGDPVGGGRKADDVVLPAA